MTTTFQPSEQQVAIRDWTLKGSGSAIVLARAGCGKTTAIFHCVVVPIVEANRGEVAVMMFNKSIADEAKAKNAQLARDYRLPEMQNWKRVQIGTCHSFGYRAWQRQMTTPRDKQVDDKKVHKIVDARAADDHQLRDDGPNVYRTCGHAIIKAVSLAKQSAFGVLCGLEDRAKWYELLEHHGVNDLPDGLTLDNVIPAAISVLKASIALDREVVDFDDMIFAPLIHKVRFWQKDWVVLEEAQDVNAARRCLALAMLKPRGRLVAVGDDRQAIYGFTGADADALDIIQRQTNAITLPLNVTYRCPAAVVREANAQVPDLTAHPSAPEGIVRTLPTEWVEEDASDATNPPQRGPWFLKEKPAITSVILCRNTKPLIEQAYSMLRHGVGCRIEGREIGEGLISLAKRWKRIKTLPALVKKLDDYQARETARWQAKGKEDRAQQVEDKCETIRVLCEQLTAEGRSNIADLEEFIRGLFGDLKPGEKPQVVTLSTIHKSKGREWPTVYFLDRSATLPSKWARQEWQLRQEENLEYVAKTRAMGELVYLEAAA